MEYDEEQFRTEFRLSRPKVLRLADEYKNSKIYKNANHGKEGPIEPFHEVK